MTTIVIPSWLAWTLAILIGLPLATITLFVWILGIVAVISFIREGRKPLPSSE